MTVTLALASVPIFQFVPQEMLKRLGTLAKIIEKNAGDAVLMHGEPVLGIYVVGEGAVGVYPPRATRALLSLASGGSFGEMSFLERSHASATIRAEQAQTKLALFPQAALALLVDADPALGRYLYQGLAVSLSQKLRATTDRITQLIDQARRLVDRRVGVSDALSDLLDLPRDLAAQRETADAALARARALLDELIERHPEKAGSLHELGLILDEMRGGTRRFYPDATERSRALVAIVLGLEAHLAEAH